MNKLIKKKAFTIIELIVVIAILGILVLLGMSNFTGNIKKAQDTKAIVATKTIEDASAMYYMDNDDWPRLSNDAYTSSQLETFATTFYDIEGHEVDLDPNGNYYDIDYDKLNQYAKAPENKKDYILQNPVGKVYYMGNLSEIGEDRVDYISKKQANSSIPNIPTISEITRNSATVTGQDGTEVKLNDGEWFNSPHTFISLDENTEYTVYVRFKATNSLLPSKLSSDKFTTSKQANVRIPLAPVMSGITTENVLVTGELGTEVKIGNGEWFNSPYTFTNLEEDTEYTVYARFKETNTHNASVISEGVKFTTKSVVLYNFTTHTFTNAGQTGRTGPSQGQLDNAYKNSVVKNYVTSDNGIQTWIVPKKGVYRIEAYGAEGGNGAWNNTVGGKGAIMKGDFTLNSKSELKILVGHQGSSYEGGGSSGSGGGGTFIATADNIALLVAGGGGGSHNQSGLNAKVTNNGTAGGKNIAGGSVTNSGAGGGFTESGYSSKEDLGGKSFIEGGLGGVLDDWGNFAGGFGGGGSAHPMCGGACGAGGGGGYSGGDIEADRGQGGGSFNSGTNQANSIGNSGYGKVVITYIGD